MLAQYKYNEEIKRERYRNIANDIKEKIYLELENDISFDDEKLRGLIDRLLYGQEKCIVSVELREFIQKEIVNAVCKLDILQELLDDDDITEIMINGYEHVFVERNGRISRWSRKFDNNQQLEDIAQRIAGMSNRIVNEAIPIVDTRLADGSRVNIVLPPVALCGPTITIRKFYDTPITIERLIQLESLTMDAANFLEKAVTAGYNIFISGGTGSGKTTFLNALSNFIPSGERVITIEDSAELQIRRVENLVRLEARNANVEGRNAITIRELVKSSLRMRPDRIVVGEIRGPEAIDLIQAMNTGHDGSLSTGHSNSPADMISRLETMVLMGMDMPITAIRQQIASAIDIIVHLGRLRDKTRHVLKIVEICGMIQDEVKINTLFEFKEKGEKENGKVEGELERKFGKLCRNQKMEAAGISDY